MKFLSLISEAGGGGFIVQASCSGCLSLVKYSVHGQECVMKLLVRWPCGKAALVTKGLVQVVLLGNTTVFLCWSV